RPALERLDLLMARVLPGTLAAAVCAVIDTGAAAVRLSHAGHVPTIVGSTTGASFVAAASGDALLGVRHGPRREQHVALAPGEALVMYSDGLIERRDRPIAARLDDERHVDDTSVLVVRRG
ncbi:MAG TPA: SpoIIE family protein phosphatase, partial [Ilumatobacteraceae bacterium]|nr:SpoIIE family protein phosphatase [Ilumatobacteraceae bacterium]